MNIKSRIINLIYQKNSQCLLCDAVSSYEVCYKCQQLLECYWRCLVCPKCGRYYDGQQSIVEKPVLKASCAGICSQCLEDTYDFDFNRSAAPYNSILQEPLKQLKYTGKRSLAETLGSIMADVIKGDSRYWQGQILLPVPLHVKKLQSRGFNQAQLLAEVISQELSLVLRNDLVVRIKETQSQARLDKVRRRNNMKNAFEFSGDADSIKGEKIIVIDDAFTTGSTLNEIAIVLKAAGAARIFGLTLTAGAVEKPLTN